MRRPKIGLVSHSASLAGAERVLVNNAIYLSEAANFDLTVLLPAEGPAKELLSARKIQCLVFPYSWFLPEQGSDEDFGGRLDHESKIFSDVFRELDFDLVIVNTAVMTSATLGAWRADIPAIVEFHGIFSTNLFQNLDVNRFRFLEYLNLLIASRVVTPSAITKKSYMEMFDFSETKLSVIPNALNLPTDWRPIEVPGQDKLFIMVANVEPNKNPHMFIMAAAEVIKAGHEAKFEVYGDVLPEYKRSLEGEIVRYGLTGIVDFRGATSNLSQVYDRCMALCVCSEYESFSMVAVEAMSHGRPVLATRCGGPEDIVVNEETGFLIDRGASGELAAKIVYLLSNLPIAKQMGEAARMRCDRYFNIDNAGQEWVELIDRVLSEKQIGSRPSELLISIILREFFSPPQSLSWAKIRKNEPASKLRRKNFVVDMDGSVDGSAFSLADATPDLIERNTLHLEASLNYFDNHSKIRSGLYSLVAGFSLNRDRVFKFYSILQSGSLEGLIFSFIVSKPTWHGKIKMLITDVANIEKRSVVLNMDSIITKMPTLFSLENPIEIAEPTIYLIQLTMIGNTPEIDNSIAILEFERIDGTEVRQPYCLFVYEEKALGLS